MLRSIPAPPVKASDDAWNSIAINSASRHRRVPRGVEESPWIKSRKEASMTLHGRVKNGVVILTDGPPPPDGTLVRVTPVDEITGAGAAPAGTEPAASVSREQRDALLGLIGIWKTAHPPSDEEVEQIVDEAKMKKYG
jgi:hypothetical protein